MNGSKRAGVILTNTMTRHQKIIVLDDGLRQNFDGGIVLLLLGILKLVNQNTDELKMTLPAYNRCYRKNTLNK